MRINIKNGATAIAILLITATGISQNNEIKITESTVEWKGKKITGSHNGTVAMKEGVLIMENEKLVGGSFVMDMTTINVQDLKGDGKEKLEGHLKSDDFFGVASYPTSTLIIKSANKTENGYYVNGEITIKDKTEPIAFELAINGNQASTQLKIDRTKFGVRYGSGSFFDNLGDNTIYDNFELDVTFKI